MEQPPRRLPQPAFHSAGPTAVATVAGLTEGPAVVAVGDTPLSSEVTRGVMPLEALLWQGLQAP